MQKGKMSFILRTSSEAIGVGADPEAAKGLMEKESCEGLLPSPECRWEKATHPPKDIVLPSQAWRQEL